MNASDLVLFNASACIDIPQVVAPAQQFSPEATLIILGMIAVIGLYALTCLPDTSEQIEKLGPHAHLISDIDPRVPRFFDALLASELNDPSITTSTIYGYIEVDLATRRVLKFHPNEYDKGGRKLPDNADLYENLKQITPTITRYFTSTATQEKIASGTFDRMLIGITLVTNRTQIRGYHQDRRTGQAAQKIADTTLPANKRWIKNTNDDALLFIYQPSSTGSILPTVSVHKEGLPADALPGYDEYPTDVREHITAECVERYRDRFALPVMTSDRQALVIDNTKALHTTPGAKVVQTLYGTEKVSAHFDPAGDGEGLNEATIASPFLRLSAALFSSGTESYEEDMFNF